MEARAQARYERSVERWARHEDRMVEAWNEINLEMRSNRERLDEMGKQIRANTRATLIALDRYFGPPDA